MQRADRSRRSLVAILLIGVGLAAAPAIFQMFTRAPAGADMIDDFARFMNEETITDFRGYLADIDAAAAEQHPTSPAVDQWREQWPVIDDDMGDMLTTMDENLGNYRGVGALPPFSLFPWFFVIPGALVAVVAAIALRVARRDRPWPRLRWALIALGIGVLAAPAAFQMFSRAPGGARMIDDFRPLMTTAKVTTVQQYFLALGAAEGELRTKVIAGAEASSLPATRQFVDEWPQISNRMAPMIGAMSDNVSGFAGIDALPPFWLFPWFFVLPGGLVTVLAITTRPGQPRLVDATARAEESELRTVA